MRKVVLIAVLGLLCGFQSSAQEWHWVFYTDKQDLGFDPYTYFDAKAIERRIIHELPLNHPSDWPVNPDYISQVSALSQEVDFSSRWFNASAVLATDVQMEVIKALPFVLETFAAATATMALAEHADGGTPNDPEGFKGLAIAQTRNMGLNEFRAQGIDGSGVRVAVFDAGFPSVDTHEAFEHIRKRNGIIKTYDFVKKKAFVYGYGAHGTNVLSCIAGMFNDIPLGLATGAEFLLARTEMSIREPFSEEKNWLKAMEWADKNGADVINSSLGYTHHRYFTWDMDGKKSLVAKAANMAARKGMLVVNAAGNSGADESWKIIGTPADADSVLSIGGIDPWTNYHISFSSFGPTQDGRMKPNVSSYGYAITAKPKGGFDGSYGTSFAAPLVAGFAACVKQAMPKKKSMELHAAVSRAGNLYPYFDYAHGFGMPHASKLLAAIDILPTFEVIEKGEEVNLSNFVETPTRMIGEVSDKDYLYYHFSEKKGGIENYFVVDLEGAATYTIDIKNHLGQYLFIHFNGYSRKIGL
jgi:serine protease AprX